MAQRLVRAKRKIATAASPTASRPTRTCPSGSPACWRVVYLVFNEGYQPRPAPQLVREELCAEAIRLGRAAGRADARRAGGARGCWR